jgi:hypothetical protein
MCGRFSYRYTWSEIHVLYRLTTPPAPLILSDGASTFYPFELWPCLTLAPDGTF